MNTRRRTDYPDDVPEQIDADAYTSMLHMFDEAVERFRDRPAFANFGTTITYDDLDRTSRNLAAYLQQVLGIRKGDRVAIMAPNILQYPVSVIAVMRCGATVVNVNPSYTPRELEHQLNDAEVKALVIFSSVTATLAEVMNRISVPNVIVTKLDDLLDDTLDSPDTDTRISDSVTFPEALAAGEKLTFEAVAVHGSDVLFLQYTGGTTGVSKGATLTHRNLVANVLQFSAWFSNKQDPGSEVILTALPLYHIFALMVNCLYALRFGMLSVLITDPRDISALVQAFDKWKFTVMTGVNTLYNGLLHAEGFSDLESHLKLCIGGGAAVQRAVADNWRAVTGCHILEAYGLSETSPALTANRADSAEFTGSIGLALPSTEISIRDDSGNEVAVGEPGELCVRGPQVMRGYWRRDDATAECMTEDGFFRTGDVATVDERGYFRIVDRKKDMIIVSGFNVFPNEIEDVVGRCDGVLDSACIGVPDQKSGEAVRVYVVKRSGVELSADDLISFCRTELTGYKVPKQVEFLDALPKSNVGKILRRELRDQA